MAPTNIANQTRLMALFERFERTRVLVVGDFFLDRYLQIDPSLAEQSIETGLVAHQVVNIVAAPGAAGTVSSNLRALGAQVVALGLVGDDGEGYELRRALRATGVDDRAMVVSTGRHTPTYTKPMIYPVGPVGALPQELERLDIRTRTPVSNEMIEAVEKRFIAIVGQFDAVIIADQMPEAACGVISERIRSTTARLAQKHPQIWFLADSRERIGLFQHVIVKPNRHECLHAIHGTTAEQHADLGDLKQAANQLVAQTNKPAFVTLGADGMLLVEPNQLTHIPTPPATSPIDIVGAGDSVMAALTVSLCAGATLTEAALVGNLAAAVTIRQIGTTGTASPAQILARWQEW